MRTEKAESFYCCFDLIEGSSADVYIICKPRLSNYCRDNNSSLCVRVCELSDDVSESSHYSSLCSSLVSHHLKLPERSLSLLSCYCSLKTMCQWQLAATQLCGCLLSLVQTQQNSCSYIELLIQHNSCNGTGRIFLPGANTGDLH